MVEGRNIKNIGKPSIRRPILSALLLLTLSISAAAEEDTARCLKLGANESVAEFHHLFTDLITSVYERIGHCVVTIPLTPKRSEMMLSAGTLDAEWLRVEGYAERFHVDLIEVPIPLFVLEEVFLIPPGSDFNGTPEDLKGRIVGYPTGFRWIEKNLQTLGAIPKEVPSGVPVRELLNRGRFEAFAIDSVRAYQIMHSQDLKQSGKKPVFKQTTWEKARFFHMVHKRHKDKVPALKREIKKAMDAGEFDQLFALPGLSRAANTED